MGTTICCGTADYNRTALSICPIVSRISPTPRRLLCPRSSSHTWEALTPRRLGETRVDLLHLLEDLADAYPGDLDETILTEIVANSLDSAATHIRIAVDPAAQTFCVIDDGQGMRRSDLRRFHDIAATSKTRGEGIGFAGVGIKLGLLVSDQVITESRRGKDHLATTWALSGRQRAPWHWIPPLALVAERGTAVQLRLTNALSPLLDIAYVENALRRHFEPLFDESLDEVLKTH